MLESFVMHEARILVLKKGKDALMNELNIAMIVAQALIKIDMALHKPIRSEEYYTKAALGHKDILLIIENLKHFYFNLDIKNYDTNLSIEEKRQLAQNSIKILEPFIKDLKENYKYNDFQDSNDEKKTADYIVDNLLIKIMDNKELKTILNSLEKIKMNFWIENNNLKIYPLITDLLMDIIALEYAWQVDKKLIQAIITEWDGAVEAQKENNFFTINAYTKMELLEKAKYNGLRSYLLAEYTRVLAIDKKKLRIFMRHILYYIAGNHKNTMKLNFDVIKDIPTRPFLLEKTKIVIGGI